MKEENSSAYKELLAKRARQYRANHTEEQKQQLREKARIRVQKWRAKKKLENSRPRKKPRKKVLISTDKKEVDKKRESWREYKKKERASMSAQEKQRINEQRRKKYAEKQRAKEAGVQSIENDTMKNGSDFQIECAIEDMIISNKEFILSSSIPCTSDAATQR